jgi:hypothetical protein
MTMPWLRDVACFFAGVFLANATPHFIYGVCGDAFPTPFAKPPGKGLSSPTVNVAWALFNAAIGYELLVAGKFSRHDPVTLGICFAGFAVLSLFSSKGFAKKHAQ